MSLDNSYLTDLMVDVQGLNTAASETSVTEVNLTESLSNPGLQTSLLVTSRFNTPDFRKNLDELYMKPVKIFAERRILRQWDDVVKTDFNTTQRIYRLSKREPVNYGFETFQLDCCDDSLLIDAENYLSRSWFKKTPTQIVEDIYSSVFPGENLEVETTSPVQDYIAEFVHPFQAITQISERALSTVGDPSLLHFMTYQNKGHSDINTHNYRSIANMAKADPVFDFTYLGKISVDMNFGNPHDIMQYSFPRDFDALNDILNGANNGDAFVGLNMVNPLTSRVSAFGPIFGGVPGNTPYIETTNKGTEDIQNSAPLTSDRIKVLRRARMNLIEQDSIAMRLVLPFSPFLNAGRTITAHFPNNMRNGEDVYGSGKYLIVNMTHTIKAGGFGVTIIECVSDSVATGKS